MKARLMILVLVIILVCGCDLTVNKDSHNMGNSKEQHYEDEADRISSLLKEKRGNAGILDVDEIIQEIGFVKQESLLEESHPLDGSGNMVDSIAITRRVYKKDKFVYLDIMINGFSSIKEGDTISFSYNMNNLLNINRYHTDGLESLKQGIGYSELRVVDQEKILWFGFLFEKKDFGKLSELNLSANLDVDESNFHWFSNVVIN